MPIYELKCTGKCKKARDVVCKFDERESQLCKCGGKLKPAEGRSAPVLGKSRYQMQGVMADGSHVKGHFGRLARMRKKK